MRRNFGGDATASHQYLTLQHGRVAYVTETGILVHSRAPQGYPVWEHIPLEATLRTGLKTDKCELLDLVNRRIGELDRNHN